MGWNFIWKSEFDDLPLNGKQFGAAYNLDLGSVEVAFGW
jgi:hypothetical protein